ncbi:MAG: hypothetical protein QOJ19_2700 [Acidimicrobiia bacterium]|nr:hypothetical protein [Acidimicrobiia bacterium]
MNSPAFAVERRPGYDDFAVVVRSGARVEAVAVLTPRLLDGNLHAVVDVRSSEAAVERQALSQIPDWLRSYAAEHGADNISVAARDPHLRHELRRRGFSGPLRGHLRSPGDAAREQAEPDRGAAPNPAERAEVLASFVQSLVPWASITAVRPHRVGQLLTGLAIGQRQLLELDVRAGTARHPLRLRVPDRPDLQPEQVALAADIAATVIRRFPWLRVLALSFDQGDAGLRSGKLGGYAMQQARSDLHINGAYVLGDAVLPPRERPRQAGFHPYTGRSWIEDVVAHELWHAVEHDFEVRRFRDSMAFRQALGGPLGVATIEHVYDPGNEAIRRRLAQEVSGYSAENRREVTAELFTEWWLAPDPRPMARLFGTLIDRYLPVETTE